MLERDIQNLVRLTVAKLGTVAFRNNVGQGWVGRLRSNCGGTVILGNARPLHAGLCVGASDLIGWTPVEITPEMVGRVVAVFTAIECKTKTGRITTEQANFLGRVRADGGIGIVARSEIDAIRGVEEWVSGR